MKNHSKIITVFLLIIVIFLIMITIMFAVGKKTGKTPYIFNYTSFYNTGKSMEPLIPEGNLLIIKKSDTYLKGDIITYKNDEGIVVTHRIVDTTNSKYITKGDNNNYVDGYQVEYKDIYGRLVAFFPISNFLYKAKYILIIMIIIPLVLVLARRDK